MTQRAHPERAGSNITASGTFSQSGISPEGRLASHPRVRPDAGGSRPALSASGFNAARISEVLRVADAPETIWHQFSGRAIGFRVAVQKTRLHYSAMRLGERYRWRRFRRVVLRVLKLGRELRVENWEMRAGEYRLLLVREVNITNIVR